MNNTPQRNPAGSGMRYAPTTTIHGVLGQDSSVSSVVVLSSAEKEKKNIVQTMQLDT